MPDALVTTAGLGKKLGGRSVLRGLDLTVHAGERVGLVGANGGGKTTTLRLLAGLLRPDEGSGTVLGRALGARPDAAGIGYMGQRLALYPELTVAENLRFRAAAHGLAKRDADGAAARYGLEPVLGRRVERLSGGWARRAQFAACVIHHPRLLLLDEPTAGLDADTRRTIWLWVDRFAGEGAGVVVSTHDLLEAERLSSVVLYTEGNASAQAAPDRLSAERGALSLEATVLALAKPT